MAYKNKKSGYFYPDFKELYYAKQGFYALMDTAETRRLLKWKNMKQAAMSVRTPRYVKQNMKSTIEAAGRPCNIFMLLNKAYRNQVSIR